MMQCRHASDVAGTGIHDFQLEDRSREVRRADGAGEAAAVVASQPRAVYVGLRT